MRGPLTLNVDDREAISDSGRLLALSGLPAGAGQAEAEAGASSFLPRVSATTTQAGSGKAM